MDGSSIQHDADEIDWEDNGDETAIGGTHLSTPASNTGKRGRVDDGDEAGGEHGTHKYPQPILLSWSSLLRIRNADVKRHRV